ncbi:MAG: transcriptional regulator [Planctomycetaceae bacterium]|nr:transcriptional regulator [Planctomycetaceae bacterium]
MESYDTNDKFWYLKNCGLCERLSTEQIERIESVARIRTFPAKSFVYLPSDSADAVMLLVSGRVKLYHITADGKQSSLAFIEAGEVFGELTVLDAGKREGFAETVSKSSIILIPGDEMRLLMEEASSVALGITRLIGFRRRSVERRLKSLMFRSNRDRLISLLLELSERYGEPTPDGSYLDVKLSHQDMASMIGSTRETVTLTLGELQYERLIKIQRRRITLVNIESLAMSIGEDSPSSTGRTKRSAVPAE